MLFKCQITILKSWFYLQRISTLKHHLAAIALLISASCHADPLFTVSTGFDYSSGTYGDSRHSETLYIPLGLKYETSEWTFKATIPYVESSGPADTIGNGSDRINLNNGSTGHRTSSGLGDIVVSASRTVWQQGPWLLELGAKVKWATASEKDGLGTGKNDYTGQADLYRVFGKHTLFATLGAKKMGDPDGVNLKNPLFTSLGWSMKASDRTSLGLTYDFRQKIQDSGSPVREATAFATRRLDTHWKLLGYVVTGFSNASPDLAGGMFVYYTY